MEFMKGPHLLSGCRIDRKENAYKHYGKPSNHDNLKLDFNYNMIQLIPCIFTYILLHVWIPYILCITSSYRALWDCRVAALDGASEHSACKSVYKSLLSLVPPPQTAAQTKRERGDLRLTSVTEPSTQRGRTTSYFNISLPTWETLQRPSEAPNSRLSLHLKGRPPLAAFIPSRPRLASS